MKNRRLLRTLTLKHRVFGFMTIMGLIPFVCLSLMFFGAQDAARVDALSQVAAKGALRLSQMNAEIYAVVMDSRGLLLSTSAKEIEDFAASTESHLKALRSIALDWKKEALSDDAENLDAMLRNIDALIATRSLAIAAGRQNDLKRSAEISRSNESVQGRKALNESVQKLSRIYEAKVAEANAEREQLRKQSLQFISLVGLMTVLLGGAGAYIVQRTVIGLFSRMRIVMTEVAAGNTNAQFGGVDRSDEIGDFARALATFKENALVRERMTAEADTARLKVESDREATLSVQRDRAKEQSDAIEGLAEALARLSNGDLTYRINASFAVDYQKIQEDFNSAIETLHGTMTQINANTIGIQSGSAEITTASDDLSHRTEQQAATLEETSAALTHISQAVARTAENAAVAKKLALDASSGALTGGEVVKQAVEAMARIEQSSTKINQIIGVIDEIAFQTNLLALNAGVEAARAGDSGRGFAVVASEVRALAQRSAGAAKEIKTLIDVASSEVDDGVKLVGKAGLSLSVIVEQVLTISNSIEGISTAASDQANGLREVHIAITELDRATQQNAAMVEESTAASHALAHEARLLSGLMQQFTVEEADKRHTRGGRRAA